MNSVSSFDRFVRLLQAHWVENFYPYLWFIVFAIIIDIILNMIVFGVNAGPDHRYNALRFSGQVGWYTAGLFFSGLIFAGLYLRHLSSPGSALISLMRPASIFCGAF